MKTRNKEEHPKTHKIVRNFVSNNENKALDSVCEKTGLQPKDFKAEHTEKCFVFVEK